MTKEMLINVAEGEECRIAVLADGVLQELYVERTSTGSQVGNIYKGRVTNIEPSIQAAFVDFGAAKNGFLHISDVQPAYFPKGKQSAESVGKKRSRHDRPPIQECLRRGQEVTVQVTKEGIGTKGPTLTTYLSVPGRFLVMMPGMSRLGVSRKIEDDELRERLRALLEELKPPDDIGFIVRTAALDRPKREVQADLNYLLRLWSSVKKRLKTAKAPAELYQESDLVIRTIRDIYSNEIERIICDSERVALKAREFLNVVMPRGKHVVKVYDGATPLFHRFNLEREIEKIYARRVELPGGGSLVIDQTEALVAIDVNSGRYKAASNAEDTAYKTNMVAAREVARQLRLRDMGGVIIIDFIDMREEKHRREIERILRDAVKIDRARTKILKISRFGIIEMTRQRVRPSLKLSIYRQCGHCKGSGLIKSDESLALDVIRNLQLACANEQIASISLSVSPGVAEYLNNRRRLQLSSLEAETSKDVHIHGDATLAGDDVVFRCADARGSVIAWDPATAGEQAGPGTGPKARGEQWTKALEADLIDVQDLPDQEAPAADETPDEEEVYREPAETEEEELPAEVAEAEEIAEARRQVTEQAVSVATDGEAPRKKRRHRAGRKHRRKKAAQAAAGAPAAEVEPEPQAEAVSEAPPVETVVEEPAPVEPPAEIEPASQAVPAAKATPEGEAPAKKPRRRRRKSAKKTAEANGQANAEPAPIAEEKKAEPEAAPAANAAEGEAPAKKPRRRRRKSAKKAAEANSQANAAPAVEAE